MPYKISTKPLPPKRSFSFAEKKVYSICHSLVTIQEILDQLKLTLNQKQIVKALDNLVLKGFIAIIAAPKIQHDKTQNLEESPTQNPNPKANESLTEFYGELKKILIANLPAEKALLHIDELKTYSNIDKLKRKVHSMAIKLELTMNSQVGKELLALLR